MVAAVEEGVICPLEASRQSKVTMEEEGTRSTGGMLCQCTR
jgi:hypothetical protein